MNKESEKKTRRIKILLIVRWPVGGIRTFIHYVYTKFDKSNYEITIISPYFEEVEQLITDLYENDPKFIPLLGLPTDGSAGLFAMAKSIINHLLTHNYDLIQSHGFTSAMCATIPSIAFRTPHLMTSHDVFNENQFIGIQGYLKKIFVKFMLPKIDCIHCVSSDAKENLLAHIPELRKRLKKIVVIPNGIEIDRFLIEDKEDFFQIDGVSDGDFLVGFFGRFMAQKGFRFLVDAIEILSKQNLPRSPKVICFGWGGFIREEQEILLQRKLDSYFIFRPFQDNIARALRGMDVVVMPSLWEAYGLLAAETMVSGTPLIATNCIGLREVTQGTPAKTIPSSDAKALAEAIAQEILTPSKQEAEDFRLIAANRFDVKNQIVALKKLINDMVLSKN
jgi:glycosyltransferase involved in cell wall biosynthesis